MCSGLRVTDKEKIESLLKKTESQTMALQVMALCLGAIMLMSDISTIRSVIKTTTDKVNSIL